MQARLTTKPEHEVVAAIHVLDLESVKARIMDPERGKGWTRDYADGIAAAYKNFLYMLVKHPDDTSDILLSEDVDEFWHAHILQTMKYADDCERVFGNFLHHNPEIGEGSPAAAGRRVAQLDKTRRLYRKEFGEAADAAWTGAATKPAYCEAAIRAKRAYCEAAVTAKAAYCEAAIHSGKPAYCEAALRTKPAYCEASVSTDTAAYCEAAVQSGKPAYCEAAARAKPAYCEAAIRAKPAYCEATVRAKAAYCEAAVRERAAA
jgi:hypothetical protein